MVFGLCLVGVALLVLLGCFLFCLPLFFVSAWWNRGIADEVTMASFCKAVTGTAVMARSANEEKKKDADWDSRLAELNFPGDILSRPEVRAVPDLLPSTTSGCADWMAGCIDRSLSDGDLRNTLVAPSAPPSSSSSLAHDAVQEAEKKRRRLMVWPSER